MKVEFLVVGGGIGGAVLAELLARQGRRVLVLERNTRPPSWSRPEILWPATVNTLERLVPSELLRQEAILPLHGIRVFDGQRMVPILTPEVLAQARIQPWSTNPNQTRECLLRSGSFELRRGIEVLEVLKDKERIIGVRAADLASGAKQEILADWVVGDDGAQSCVRQACGIPITTRVLPVEFLCFQCDWPSEFPAATGHIFPNFGEFHSGIVVMGLLPIPGNRGVGVILIHARKFDANPEPTRSWDKFLTRHPAMAGAIGAKAFPADFARVRRPWGHARSYGAPGAVLMGDSVHPVSPAGGQGANMSVADGCALAETASSTPDRLVARYEKRRRPANARSLRFTRALVAAIPVLDRIPVSGFVAPFLHWIERHPSQVSGALKVPATAFLER